MLSTRKHCRSADSQWELLQENPAPLLPRCSLPPLHEFVLPNVKDAEPLRSEQIEAFHGVTIDVRCRLAAHANEAAMPSNRTSCELTNRGGKTKHNEAEMCATKQPWIFHRKAMIVVPQKFNHLTPFRVVCIRQKSTLWN